MRAGGDALHLALASCPERGDLWIAIERRRAGAREVVIGLLDADRGRLREVARLGGGSTWCRWPALAAAPGGGALLAWCEGPPRGAARVRAARIDRDRRLGPALDADASGAPGDAPALAVSDRGWAALAWHVGGAAATSAGDRDASVKRALRAARWELARGGIEWLPEPPGGPGGPDPRGEDQSWELASLAIDPAGAIWLAGRSSHGHHLARFDGGWSDRLSLCRDEWGGRGRRMALASRGGRIWLARRAPDGLEVKPAPSIPGSTSRSQSEPGSQSVSESRSGSRSQSESGSRSILFGDLHQHTAHSDGCGSAEDLWISARDQRGLDFAAITDHDRFCRRALGPATWDYLCQLADDMNEPGRFAALSAYEFTGPRHPGPGHKCVYFGDRVPDRVPDKDVDTIFAACRELGGIAVPHHVGWTGGDFPHHDPAIQPVWEVISVHGCYTAEGGCAAHPPRADHIVPGQFVHDALAAGLRFGFIGSTDSHGLDWHHGIARWRNPFRSGLACVFGAEPTRSSILDAIRARRTYATSGARIRLRVELDGAPMGSELPADTRGELLVEVDGTAAIARLVLVTASGETDLPIAPGDARAAVRTPAPPADPPGAYFYLRVEQADGEMAWSSPLWIG
jgi:hypothetical protein